MKLDLSNTGIEFPNELLELKSMQRLKVLNCDESEDEDHLQKQLFNLCINRRIHADRLTAASPWHTYEPWEGFWEIKSKIPSLLKSEEYEFFA